MNILFVFALNEQELKHDDMCQITRDVLCVKDVLMIVAKVARIESVDTLYRYINFEMDLIHSDLPTPQYHSQFFQLNNINQTYLDHLFLEAHYTMSFYYNSINDLLTVNDIHASTTNSWFEQIQFNLKNEIICRYRSVLHVYSLEWPSIDDIKQIEFSKKNILSQLLCFQYFYLYAFFVFEE